MNGTALYSDRHLRVGGGRLASLVPRAHTTMSQPDFECSTLSESTAPPSKSLNPTLINWAQIKLDLEFDVRARLQSMIRDIRCPWTTMELIPSSMESVVMDVLQQVCGSRAFYR